MLCTHTKMHPHSLSICVLGCCQVGLSDVYEHLRGLQSCIGAAADEAAWVPPTRFMRETTKFWLQPQDVMRFKCEMIKHLPVLVFGEREKLVAGMSALVLKRPSLLTPYLQSVPATLSSFLCSGHLNIGIL